MSTWENSHRREFHTGVTSWFRITFTCLHVQFSWPHSPWPIWRCHSGLTKTNCACATRCSPLADRFHTERIYMIVLRNFVPEWNSRSGTTTGVNLRRCYSRRLDISSRYHVNKYRATRGNRSELALAWCKLLGRESQNIVKCERKVRGGMNATAISQADFLLTDTKQRLITSHLIFHVQLVVCFQSKKDWYETLYFQWNTDKNFLATKRSFYHV